MTSPSSPPPPTYDAGWMYKFWSQLRSLTGSISVLLDTITSVRGSILFRGATQWLGLAPGTAGQFLRTNGAGADPSWADEVNLTNLTLTTSFTVTAGYSLLVVGNYTIGSGGNLIVNGSFGVF